MKKTKDYVKDTDRVSVDQMYSIIEDAKKDITSDVIYLEDCKKHDDELLNTILSFTPVTERGSIYKPVVFSCDDEITSGAVLIVNGNNGMTKFTTESISDVVEFAKLLENKFNARVFISGTVYHSDVYYYAVRFVVWTDERQKVTK